MFVCVCVCVRAACVCVCVCVCVSRERRRSQKTPGCLSTVHISASMDAEGLVHFLGDSDGMRFPAAPTPHLVSRSRALESIVCRVLDNDDGDEGERGRGGESWISPFFWRLTSH